MRRTIDGWTADIQPTSGGFTATALEFKGISTTGKTKGEALLALRRAVENHVESRHRTAGDRAEKRAAEERRWRSSEG